ncbi:MAG: zinc-dependent peptidase [Planctomycetaceae bacterium]
MLFSWLRARRRRRVRERPFPPEWSDLLGRSVRQVAWLSAADRRRLEGWLAVFLAEKRFEGCGGLAITDEVRLAVAGQAGVAALGLGDEQFDRLKSILVHPGDFRVPASASVGGDVELEWREARLGETWTGGSMSLSWPEVVAGGRMRDGPRSVVIHEFAHQFDALDGEIDGVPPLPAGRARAWAAECAACRERFDAALDEGRATPFDDYAAESPAEFFAVASECFFQDPHRLARHDPALHDLLIEAWRQDPRARVPPGGGRRR